MYKTRDFPVRHALRMRIKTLLTVLYVRRKKDPSFFHFYVLSNLSQHSRFYFILLTFFFQTDFFFISWHLKNSDREKNRTRKWRIFLSSEIWQMRYKKFLLIATNRVKISHFVIGGKKYYEHVDDEKYCCACKIKKEEKTLY